MTKTSSILENRDEIVTIIVLLFICIVSFIPFKTFASPPIASDDWSLVVAPYAFGELRPFNLSNHRPFDMSFYYVLTSIFGLRFEYFYLLNALVIFLSAVMVYTLVKRVFPQHIWLASLTAVIYLIYPVDSTRTWIMMLYIRFWWLVSLVAIWLLIDFAESGNKWKLALASLGIIVPLGAYEGQFGVVATASFLIAAVFKDKPIRRRLVLVGSTFIIGLLFYLWRFHIQARIAEIQYYSARSFEFNPLILIERYFQGFDIFFRRWLDPFQAQLGLSDSQMLIGISLYIAFSFFITFLISKKYTSRLKRHSTKIAQDDIPAAEKEGSRIFWLGNMLNFKDKLPLIKEQSMILLIGGAFWIAGYFPIIGLYSPSLSGHASRVNSFAVAGASLALTALAALLATLLASSTLQVRPFATALLFPFIFAGIFMQAQVKIEKQNVWETQRKIWKGTFETIPNILDEKGLVVILPANKQPNTSYTYPFSTAWEVDAGMKVLYNNPAISGYYFYNSSLDQQFEFRKNGIVPQGTNRLIGYKRLVFVLYHPSDNRIELVEDLEEALSLPFSVDNYRPHENIIPAQPSTADFRWLVK